MNLQRERIRNLEVEYDSLYEKFEDVISSKPISAESTVNELLQKDMSKLKSKADSEGYEDMVKSHAKEVSMLKAKMTEQGAKILLHKEDR